MQLNFDATQHDPSQTMSVCLPLDDYYFTIVKAEVEQVKDKPNEGKLTVHLRIEQGPYKGTIQKDYFNIYNSNPQAVQIAYRELSALCHVVNRLRIAQESDLVGGQGRAAIGPQANNDKYSEVKQYKYIDGSLPGANGQPQQQQTQQQPTQAFQPQQQAATSGFAQTQQQPQQTQQQPFGQNQPAQFPPALNQPPAFGGNSPQQPSNKPPWAN